MHKKAFVRTIEGAISTLILLTFIFYVIPHIPAENKIDYNTKKYAADALKNMDDRGILSLYITGNTANLTAIKDALNETIPSNLNYTVGISKINATSSGIFSEDNYKGANISYAANYTRFRYAYIILNFINSTNPEVYENGEEIYSYNGQVPEEYIKLDLTAGTIDGSNNIEIRTLNNSTVSYMLIIQNEDLLSEIPDSRPTAVITYVLDGKYGSFEPSIIKTYIWK